jgi:DNA-binding transcriptional LysR family regulator
MSTIWMPAQMALFAKIVDLNGFSAAARALGVPKAAASRSIAELEAALGVRLLERTTRRIRLTPVGRLLYPHCRRIVDEADAVRAAAADAIATRGGPLRVMADPTYGRVLLAPIVPRFLERFPDVPLDVQLQAVDFADASQWDVAVQVGAIDDARYVCRELGAPPAVLCATPAYLAAKGTPAKPAELRGHALLTPAAAGPEYRVHLHRGASQREEVSVHPKLAVNDPAVLHASTAAGLGIGLLPEFLCRQGLVTGKLVRVLDGWALPGAMPICAIYPSTLATDRRVQAYVEFLAANVIPALASS